MSSLKASIIVAVYNGEKTLGLTIDSLLAQTYDNFEILLIDDGSSDGSKALIESYMDDPRVKYHAKPNGGEVRACRWWLDLERDLIRPKLIVALGATAASAVLGKIVTIRDTRSKLIDLDEGTRALVTVHPSYILRLPDKATQEREREAFHADMALVRETVPELAL